MTGDEVASMINGCLRYIAASKLPSPLPTNPLEYLKWREKVSEPREINEDDEDAWFELDRLLAKEPGVGWRILAELASRCDDEDSCAQLAAGPLRTFLHAHRDEFSSQIEEELMQNAGLRAAFNWMQQ